MTSLLENYKALMRLAFPSTAAFRDSLLNCTSDQEINALLDHLLADGYSLEELLAELLSGGFDDSHTVVKLLKARIEAQKSKEFKMPSKAEILNRIDKSKESLLSPSDDDTDKPPTP
ncbi:hypothetical protein IB233_02220 [Comamonas sp. CMM01]|uniref:hypothetical protein n=1 Tax=Comamonas sp. CMM01 TaxID=2769280 RepID=UPI00177BE8CF|nr:hypothetical protein [Comamonas sp. CMM01]MBD9530448.1 hypothetical protein [Comamonas sp. CMM01]